MTLEPGGSRWAGSRVGCSQGTWPLAAIALSSPVSPPCDTFLVSLVWQPPVPKKDATAPKLFLTTPVETHLFSHSTASVGPMPHWLELFPSLFLFLDHQTLSQALPRLCSQHFPVCTSNRSPGDAITPIIIPPTSRSAAESSGKPSSTFLSSTAYTPGFQSLGGEC